MQFTTRFEIAQHDRPINHDSHIVLLGSCFSQHIYDKLRYYGISAISNPFGTLFNPYTISHLISKSINDDFKPEDVETTFSYLAHSDISGGNEDEVLSHMKDAGQSLRHHLEKATHVIITLGTAWVYALEENNQIVASCHQQPQRLFKKRLLSIEEISDRLNSAIKDIDNLSQASILFTLSPVRHTRDGMIENQRSKARLHEAIQQQVDKQSVYYFPSYELLMDDLRDYRYYDRDMIHPNATAVDYVWSRFRESVISTNLSPTLNDIAKYRKLEQHKPKDAQKNEKQLAQAATKLKQKYPKINL